MTGKAGKAGGQTDRSDGGQPQPSGEAVGIKRRKMIRADGDECGGGRRRGTGGDRDVLPFT